MSAEAIHSYKKRVNEVDAQRKADKEHFNKIFFNVEHYGDYVLDRLILYDMVDPGYVNKVRNEAGDSLLHYAARCGKLDAVQTLLAMGADLEAMNLEGKKPIDVICTRLWTECGEHEEITKLKHEFFTECIQPPSTAYTIFGSCQDPAFPLYAKILDVFEAAKTVCAQVA